MGMGVFKKTVWRRKGDLSTPKTIRSAPSLSKDYLIPVVFETEVLEFMIRAAGDVIGHWDGTRWLFYSQIMMVTLWTANVQAQKEN